MPLVVPRSFLLSVLSVFPQYFYLSISLCFFLSVSPSVLSFIAVCPYLCCSVFLSFFLSFLMFWLSFWLSPSLNLSFCLYLCPYFLLPPIFVRYFVLCFFLSCCVFLSFVLPVSLPSFLSFVDSFVPLPLSLRDPSFLSFWRAFLSFAPETQPKPETTQKKQQNKWQTKIRYPTKSIEAPGIVKPSRLLGGILGDLAVRLDHTLNPKLKPDRRKPNSDAKRQGPVLWATGQT